MYFTRFIYIQNIFRSNLQPNYNFDNVAKTRYMLTKCHGHVSEIVLSGHSWSNLHFETAIKDRGGGLLMKLYFHVNKACILTSTTTSKIIEFNEWSKIIFFNWNHSIISDKCADDFFFLFRRFRMIALQIVSGQEKYGLS